MKNTKQVIVMRTDLNMRKGKIAAQAAHASMAFMTHGRSVQFNNERYPSGLFVQDWGWAAGAFEDEKRREICEQIKHWLDNSFRKICVGVDSEEELLKLHKEAKDIGLMSHLITDNGATEFNGVPTNTCICIGPHWDEKIDAVTGNLKLL